MTNIDVAQDGMAELELADRTPTDRRTTGWETCVTITAAVSAIGVVSAVLLTLTAELRAGWVPGHELPMDKAAAIHKLLFRP